MWEAVRGSGDGQGWTTVPLWYPRMSSEHQTRSQQQRTLLCLSESQQQDRGLVPMTMGLSKDCVWPFLCWSAL